MKYIISCFQHIHRIIQPLLLSHFRKFLQPPEETSSGFTLIFSLPGRWSTLIYFLFEWIFLFYTFHINTCPFVSGLFHLYNVFKVLLCGSTYQYSTPLYGWIIFHCADILHFTYLLIGWQTFGLYPHFGYYEKWLYISSCTSFV